MRIQKLKENYPNLYIEAMWCALGEGYKHTSQIERVSNISALFSWNRTQQGSKYWNEVYLGIRLAAKEAELMV